MTQNSIESSSGMGVVVNSNVNVNNDNHNHSTIMTTMVTTDNNNVNPPIAAPIPTSSASTTATTCTPMATTNVRRIRRYRIFPGRNRFFCDGRIIMAKQISVFYFTVALLVGTCVCFFIFDSPYLSNKISPLVPIVAAFLFLFVLFCLLRTSFTDPGILPRATPAEAADVEQQIVPNQSNSSTMRPPPRTKEVMINNQMIKLKYCFTCKIFRPPRASHCSLCDNCVERFDHHCPWVGNCVGKRNYRFFYMFIVSLAFLCIYVFSCIITHFILLSKTMTFVEAVKQSPVSVVEMIICFFSVWSILGLAGFHTYLIMSNLTTNEDIKGSFSKRNHVSIKNPYSQGSIFRNCYSILCAPIGPSLIHRRSYVYCEESIITTAASASASSSANNCNNYHHQPISSSSAAAKQSQSIRFAANVAYPLQPTISGQQQQQQSIPVMANYYHHNHHAHLQQPNKSPQIISHQLKQSNGQSQYYVPIIKNSNQSQQHLHPDSHGQVYLGHDIDELDKQQQRLATQHHYYQQPPQSDNMLISESFNANDPLHHHHHYQTCAQQACYYHQKSSSSSSPSVRHHSNVAPPQSDNYATTMIIDPYYPNLAKKNSPSIMIDTDNDYCNYPTQHFIHNSNSNSNSNSNQQKSTTIPTTSCSHHHNHHHHHHHAANSSKASSSTGSCNSTTTYQSRSSSTNQPHSQPKRSQTTVKGQTQPPSTKQTNKIN
ncbi:Palmitoyltransferase zdhhc14 [Dermatophagoides pteronyssinus]|uniref:Palmitoyltransferase n=1 Tax=Dermatophagoides pteronyssinus TaxID=6956 RepID=A0ABQ8JRX9_DERPT|nr:Palmitoyltransferase zdhhc14 [Dermatophagoides pteronyssinus]